MKNTIITYVLCSILFNSCDVPKVSKDNGEDNQLTVQSFNSIKTDNIDVYIRQETNHKNRELLKTISILPNETLITNIKPSVFYSSKIQYFFIAVIRNKTDTLLIDQYDSMHSEEFGEIKRLYFYIDNNGLLTKVKPIN